MNWSELFRSRTFWSAIGAAVTAVGLGIAKVVTWPEVLATVWAAAQTIFIRNAVAAPAGGK